MKVLFQSRQNLLSVPGGDTIQMLKTAEALRKLDCLIDISPELEPDVGRYDIVHLFNVMRPQEVYLQALNAKKQLKKIALSTIYVDFREADKKSRTGVAGFLSKRLSGSKIEYLKVWARIMKNREINKGTLLIVRKGFARMQSELLQMVDILLPNSESEMKRIRQDFPDVSGKQVRIVPNGFDRTLFDPLKVSVEEELEKYRNCVLCVGRIEPLKNQLNLVRAMKGLQWPLLIIGKSAPNHNAYFERVRREADSNVVFLGHIEHDMLPRYFKIARVHVLASWFETTGLSSLEAAAMGCNVVITGKGDTRDYFQDFGFYCEPDSVESIRNAIVKAYRTPADSTLREYVLNNFTWDRAAEATLNVYAELVSI